jgi:hypothetical protein
MEVDLPAQSPEGWMDYLMMLASSSRLTLPIAAIAATGVMRLDLPAATEMY